MRALFASLLRAPVCVFTSPRTRKRDNIDKVFKRALERAGITTGDVSPDPLRHTAVYRVSEDHQRGFVTLFHGTTVHGRQALGPNAPDPLTYITAKARSGVCFLLKRIGHHSQWGWLASVSVPWRRTQPPATNGRL